MISQWYISRNGSQYGPYSWQELKDFANDGNLTGSDYVYEDSLNDWTLANNVPNLFTSRNNAPKPIKKQQRFKNTSGRKLISIRPRIRFFPYGGKLTFIVVMAIVLISIIAGIMRGDIGSLQMLL